MAEKSSFLVILALVLVLVLYIGDYNCGFALLVSLIIAYLVEKCLDYIVSKDSD